MLRPASKRTINNSIFVLLQQCNRLPESKGDRKQLSIQAVEQDATVTQYHATAFYNISHTMLNDRRTRKMFQRDCMPNLMKQLKIEDDVIVYHILNLHTQGFLH